MKTIKHEIKLEKSVKIILGAFVFGIILNAFVTPTGQELFGIKKANAAANYTDIERWPNQPLRVYIENK
tara:strand:+ start:105 stop:311 length:207 start_codon:yes stop_codon:yes gene_type:complete